MSLPQQQPHNLNVHIGQKRSGDGFREDDGEDGPNKKKRRQVKRACLNCRIAHAACDNQRPCTRCVQYGLEVSCLDVERKNSKKRKDTSGSLAGQLGQLGQLGTIAGLNQLLQIPGIVNALQQQSNTPAPPPTPPSSTQVPTQNYQALSSPNEQRDIPHNVYLTHEYLPILTQLAAQNTNLINALHSINQKQDMQSPSPSPQHTTQQYAPHNFLPPILPAPPGNSMTNFISNARQTTSGLANIQLQLAQSSPQRTMNPPAPVPSPRQNSPQYGTPQQYPFSSEPSSPSSPQNNVRLFKPNALSQALANVNIPSRTVQPQTPDMFMENDEIDVVKHSSEDLSHFLRDDYFTGMFNDDPVMEEDQSWSEHDISVTFPQEEEMCIAVWTLEGCLYSANHHFMNEFKVSKNTKIANGEGNPLLFEDLLPKNDVMFRSVFKQILTGRSPFYTGPTTFVQGEEERIINAFSSCYLVRGGINQDPRYVVTHISIVK